MALQLGTATKGQYYVDVDPTFLNQPCKSYYFVATTLVGINTYRLPETGSFGTVGYSCTTNYFAPPSSSPSSVVQQVRYFMTSALRLGLV